MAGERIPVAHISEQLGALKESMERGREDRQEFREELQNLRQAINGLQQSNITTNAILSELAKQELSARLHKLEQSHKDLCAAVLNPEQVKRFKEIDTIVSNFQKALGSTKTVLFKLIVAFLTCTTTAGFIVAGLLHWLGH